MSTAGNATINNNNGGTIFAAMTNAGTAHITNVNGGGTEFFEKASAASATIVNNSGGFTSFGPLWPGYANGRPRHDHQQFRRRNGFQRLLHRRQCDHHHQQRRRDVFL